MTRLIKRVTAGTRVLVTGAGPIGLVSVQTALAFGATEVYRNPPDERGRTMHVHLYVNDGSLMLSDAYPEYGYALEKPQGYSLMLPLAEDIQVWFDRAVAAGCEVVQPVQKMFWGDLYGQVRDPFGVLWAMNQPQT